MQKLTKDDIQFIDNYLVKNVVKYWDVRAELLDHVISSVEDKIQKKGTSFNQALLEIHEGFGNKLGHFKTLSFEKSLFYSNKGFKAFTRAKQKEIGRKYRRLYLKGLKDLLISPKFLLEYVLFIVAFYFCYVRKSRVDFWVITSNDSYIL